MDILSFVCFALIFSRIDSSSPVQHDMVTDELPSGTIDEFNSAVFNMLTTPPAYDRHLPPQEQRPIQVNISAFLFGYGNIDDKRSDFQFNLLVRIVWLDERLRPWNATIAKDKPMTIFEGGAHHLARLWTPSLHVPNSAMPSILEDKTQAPVLTRIQSDGKILVSKRIALHGIAQMDYRLYPLDIQKIEFVVESNELSNENLNIAWTEDLALDTHENFQWNGFTPVSTVLAQTTANYTHTGTFSRVTATFYLRRQFEQFLLDVYIPLFLYCVMAYGSCWIEITALPGRIALGVTVLLTMVTTAKNARENLPSVSYIHALDIFITGCTIFVFATFVELIMVNYFYYKQKRFKAKVTKRMKSMRRRMNFEQRQPMHHHHTDTSPMSTSFSDDVQVTVSSLGSSKNSVKNADLEDHSIWLGLNDTKRPKSWTKRVGDKFQNVFSRRKSSRAHHMEKCEETAYEIDRVARIVFPIAFLVFNIIYWASMVVLSSRNLK